jgi:hypothetical protein
MSLTIHDLRMADWRDWLVLNVFNPETKDSSHSEMVTEHLKALDRSPTWNIFEHPPKDTGVLHEDPEARVSKALEKMR